MLFTIYYYYLLLYDGWLYHVVSYMSTFLPSAGLDPQHCSLLPGLLSLVADGPRAPPSEPDVEAKQDLDRRTLGHTKAKSGQSESQKPCLGRSDIEQESPQAGLIDKPGTVGVPASPAASKPGISWDRVAAAVSFLFLIFF